MIYDLRYLFTIMDNSLQQFAGQHMLFSNK
jgi:hypothetical protein